MAIHTIRNDDQNPATDKPLRQIVLEVIADLSKQGSGYFQTNPILNEIAARLGRPRDLETQQAILQAWQGLFVNGHLSWGYDLSNPGPPFCHLTEKGRQAQERLSRDPANPDGYVVNLNHRASIDSVAMSYLREALNTYNSNCYKASAVMVGAAAERLVLCLRDKVLTYLSASGASVPSGISDWRIKTVRDALTSYFDGEKPNMPRPLRESYSAYWSGFSEHIRRVRNDAGHPESVDPVTPESVHSALLIFPELAVLVAGLETWLTP